jgi:hypothetical protein
MKDLKRFNETQENELFKAYDILSAAGFKIQIEGGQMMVWPRGASIEMDYEEGMVIVPEEYEEEFNERQEELEEEDNISIEYHTEYHTDEETGITVPVKVTYINK